MELTLIVGLLVLGAMAIVGMLGYVIDRAEDGVEPGDTGLDPHMQESQPGMSRTMN